MPGLLSGVLPYLYSQSDRLKRNVNGLLSDPMGTMEQTAGGLLDSHRGQTNLLAQAFADPSQPFRVTDAGAMQQAATNMLAGPLGLAPAGITMYRAGAPQGMTAAQGGPTFYASERKGAEPFTRGGHAIQQYDIDPKQVLDTQLIKYRDLYEQFIKETKHPAGYGNTARPYWTAEHEFKKWLDAKGQKFDAIMFDEPTMVPSYAIYGER